MPSKKIKVPDFYYQEMTAAGYRQIEDQIEALKKQRPEKIAQSSRLLELWAIFPKILNTVLPNGI